jgi:DNA-binding CsgD family transcriptional regulator
MSYLRRVPISLSDSDQHALLALVSDAAATHGARPFERHTIESLLRMIPAKSAGYFEYATVAGCWTPTTFFVDEPAAADPAEWVCSYAVETTIGSWPLRDQHRNVRGRPLKFSDFFTRAQMLRNPWYCEVMRPSGNEHEIKVWLSAPADTVRGFYLVRERGQRDFDERDRDVLEILRPHLAAIRERWERRRRLPLLTRREAEVLELVALGLTNPEIADRLVLSRTTVRTHLENVFAKLNVHTRTAAVARLQDHAALV